MKDLIKLTAEEYYKKNKEIQDDFFKDANYISEKIKLFSEKFKDVDYNFSSMFLGNFRIRFWLSVHDKKKSIDYEQFDELSNEIELLSKKIYEKWGDSIAEVIINSEKSYLKISFSFNCKELGFWINPN
jgi:hypothetical protein